MNYIILICLSTSLAGLFMIYLAASNSEPEMLEIGDLSQESVGRVVTIEGQIKSKKLHEEGHVFLTISDGGKLIQAPIFSNVAQYMDIDSLKEKSGVRITGTVDDYRGQLQVIPRKPNDIELSS